MRLRPLPGLGGVRQFRRPERNEETRHGKSHFRRGMFLGRRSRLPASQGGQKHRRRLHGRDDQQPDLRGSLHRSDRPRRGGRSRVRSGRGELRAVARRVLGQSRSHAAATARAPTSARSIARPSSIIRPRNRPRPKPRSSGWNRAASTRGRSPPRSCRPRPSTAPKSTTSSTWKSAARRAVISGEASGFRLRVGKQRTDASPGAAVCNPGPIACRHSSPKPEVWSLNSGSRLRRLAAIILAGCNGLPRR